MPIKIASAGDIRKKWETVTPGRVRYYETGVKDPAVDWAGPAIEARAAYEAGVTAAIAEDRRGKGIAKVGTTGWREGAVKKGPRRFTEGVRIAGPAFQEGFGPYRETISAIDLPPRGARGDPANLARVEAVTVALHERRIALLGAGS